METSDNVDLALCDPPPPHPPTMSATGTFRFLGTWVPPLLVYRTCSFYQDGCGLAPPLQPPLLFLLLPLSPCFTLPPPLSPFHPFSSTLFPQGLKSRVVQLTSDSLICCRGYASLFSMLGLQVCSTMWLMWCGELNPGPCAFEASALSTHSSRLCFFCSSSAQP